MNFQYILTWEVGGELLLFSACYSRSWDSFTTWAWARDLHRRCIYYPSPTRGVCEDMVVIPSTCIRERDIVVTLLVRVCVCLSVCLHLIAS